MNATEFYKHCKIEEAAQAQQEERNELFRNIRHLCNTCQPPKHLTIEMLTSILETLRGHHVDASLANKGE
jgi:hypothetical protein